MTDKATVEIPAPVDGEVTWLAGEPGQKIAVGAPLVRIRTEGGESAPAEAAKEAAPAPQPAAPPRPQSSEAPAPEGKPLASPAVRLHARNAHVDLREVRGSGKDGHILHADVDLYLAARAGLGAAAGGEGVTAIRIIGLRRRIAEQTARAWARIPHITLVEEVDVTALQELRAALNKESGGARPHLTFIPFLMRAMVTALAEQPKLNALYDDAAEILRQHASAHIGVATQTPQGLVAPVVRHAERRDLWDCAAEIARLATAAREGHATREELAGSTITITSLGALGGVVTTPIINWPEVAIVGVNKIAVRPVWQDNAFVPRNMMNLSSSFDHRIIDGFEAATFVRRLKALLEAPAELAGARAG
jgi:2-oxoisovalerate dehydrogenase E2 component (dihydrolipoyl transacylase)